MKTTLLEKSRRTYMSSIPADELLSAMKDLTPKAYQLLMYHYSKNSGWNFNDLEIAESLGISERMVKQYRRELIEKDYLMIIKGKVDLYFIGRQSVLDFKAPNEISRHKEKKVDLIKAEEELATVKTAF